MIKKIKIISIVVFSILLVSCGFKIINQTQSLIYIQNINVTGDRQAGSIIKNNIALISNEEAKDKYTIDLKANKKTSTKIKNEKGKTTRYELIIMADLVLTNINDQQIIIKKTFSKSVDYEATKLHFDTIINEKKAFKTATQEISEQIINFIIFSIKNK